MLKCCCIVTPHLSLFPIEHGMARKTVSILVDFEEERELRTEERRDGGRVRQLKWD